MRRRTRKTYDRREAHSPFVTVCALIQIWRSHDISNQNWAGVAYDAGSLVRGLVTGIAGGPGTLLVGAISAVREQHVMGHGFIAIALALILAAVNSSLAFSGQD